MSGGIGSHVQDADDLDYVTHDSIVESVVLDWPNPTTRKKPGQAAADFWKVGKRGDRAQ